MEFRSLLSAKIACFQHCSDGTVQFYRLASPPLACSHCGQPLDAAASTFKMEPFAVPSPLFTDARSPPAAGTLLLPLDWTNPTSSSEASDGGTSSLSLRDEDPLEKFTDCSQASWARGCGMGVSTAVAGSRKVWISPYHVGIVDEKGMVHHYDDSGGWRPDCLLPEGMWWGAVRSDNVEVEGGVVGVSEAVRELVASGLWTAERYDSDTHNCLDFVAAVLTKISKGFVDMAGNSKESDGGWSLWDRDTVLRAAVKPAIVRLARYLKVARTLATS